MKHLNTGRFVRLLSVAAVLTGFATIGGGELFAQTTPAPQPSICARSCWNATSNSLPGTTGLNRAVIHHTAGTYGNVSLSHSKDIVRGIQSYHKSLGWLDIGYHFLTDALGSIFQGRYGSMTSGTYYSGAHDGVNASSYGFSALGNYENNAFTTAGRNAMWDVIGWRMPSGWSPYGSGSYGGSSNIGYTTAHRNVSLTACPGTNIYNTIGTNFSGGEARDAIAARRGGGGGSGAKQHVYVFGRGTGGGCLIRHWNASTGWGDWWSLGGGIVGGPGGYSRGPNHVGVVSRKASDNSIQARHWTNHSGWSTWSNLGGNMTSDPSAAARGDNKVHVAARGQDGAAWLRTRTDGSGWANWYSLGGNINGRPSAYSKNKDHLAVAALFGNPGTIKVKVWTASDGWRSYWSDIGGNMVSAPAAVVRGDTKVHIFARNANGNCYLRTHTQGQGWANWYSLGAPPGGMVNAPAAYSRGSGHVAVVVRNGNNRCYKKTWTSGGGWGSWDDLGNGNGGFVSSPGAAAR